MNAKLFLLAFLLWMPLKHGKAQEKMSTLCEGKLVEELDSITGAFTRSYKEKLIVQNSPEDLLDMDLKQFNEVLVFSVLVKGAGDCLDESSKMITTFTSGATVTLMMQGNFNCDREFVAFFGDSFGKKKEFRMFFTNEIEIVRVETRKSIADKNRKNFVEVRFTSEQAKEFIQRLECLLGP
jgi:hypothetical protein